MIAFFPGQGSQHVGMGKELLENFDVARRVFQEASEAVKLDLRKLCLDGPESALTLTENTQPCLLTVSVAAYRVASEEAGFRPRAAAGHSLGEYSALVAIGALPLSAAALWVRERGRAMQAAVPAGEGTMAAVMGLDDAAVEKLCETATGRAIGKRRGADGAELSVEAVVQPANFNAPGQVVIAGSRDAVDEAVRMLQSGEVAGGKAVPLTVSAPFHCRLMAPARDRMAALFAAAGQAGRPKAPACPYVPNRTAALNEDPDTVFDLLVEQVDHPVLWKQSVRALIDAGFEKGVEFGPGRVLQGLAKRIARDAGRELAVASMGDVAGLKALEKEASA